MSAIAEKRPWLMMPRDFFLGLWRVMAWDYWWGYSAAQVELMAVDAPLVVYPEDKNKKKGPRKSSALQVLRAEKKFKEQYGDGRNIKIDLSNYK